ncbi:hypothetical protein RIE95_10110 [Acidithiobacillus thiooxidans]|uniref:hypothetical protein n=1 Tax=Acidithiobacillus thiooxidans TaxID=930 RepID=UPI0028581176|nr:hypothetical protein [Acidithiobacillus thiooxidans]MDR7927329.1 hypothetical protein [Acidithiobacillus thiooxidans]
MMVKLLQLSTYPIVNPNHGGQIRSHAIKKQLIDIGFTVFNCSVSESGHEFYSEDDLIIKQEDIDSVVNVPFCGDLATSELCISGLYYEFLKNKIDSIIPEVIVLEQPWLWPAVKKYLTDNGNKVSHVKVVYSSQNIEYKTKKSILSDHGISSEDVISRIYELERDLCENCFFSIAVSKYDAELLNAMGSFKTIVAANGVHKRIIQRECDFIFSKALLGRRYALFVGSAYPPNAVGFWKMVNHSLSFLKNDEFIAVAGGISDIILPYGEIDSGVRFQHNKNKTICYGKVSEQFLLMLIGCASAILLPIVSGGGSNLKTAEAIASGKPVVATKTACRGYELNKIQSLTNFTVCDDGDVNLFKSSISYYLSRNNDNVSFSDEENLFRESVLWEKTLLTIVPAFQNIFDSYSYK